MKTKHGAPGDEVRELRNLVMLLARFVLSSGLQLRIFRACTLTCHSLPTSNRWIIISMEATKADSVAQAEIPKENRIEKLHHPHTHVMNAWLGLSKTIVAKLITDAPRRFLKFRPCGKIWRSS